MLSQGISVRSFNTRPNEARTLFTDGDVCPQGLSTPQSGVPSFPKPACRRARDVLSRQPSHRPNKDVERCASDWIHTIYIILYDAKCCRLVQARVPLALTLHNL